MTKHNYLTGKEMVLPSSKGCLYIALFTWYFLAFRNLQCLYFFICFCHCHCCCCFRSNFCWTSQALPWLKWVIMWPVTPSYSVLENRSFLTNSLMSGLKSVYFNLVMTLCYRTVSVRSTIFYCMSWKSLLVVRVLLGKKSLL